MLTIVTGPPCAGKTTYINEHKHDGDVVVDFDLIAKALGAASHRPDGPVKQVAFAAREGAISEALKVDGDRWIVHTSPTAARIATYEAAGAVFVNLDPGMDECLARAVQDGRPPGTTDTIRDWYDQRGKTSLRLTKEGRMMKTKTLDVMFKAGPADGLAEGEFVAYPSTFTKEPDAYGDIVAPGAFLDSLAEWKASGNILSGYYGHRMDDPDYNVAAASDYGEDEHGFWVRGAFDLESPKGPQVYRLVKGKRIGQLSFSYDVQDSGQVTLPDGRKVNELRKLKLYEFSFVPVGANQDTSVVAVKSLAADIAEGAKAGRVLSSKNETDLRDARDLIDKVLAQLDSEDPKWRAPHAEPIPDPTPGITKDSQASPGDSIDTGNASEPAKTEEPAGAKAEEPTHEASLKSWSQLLDSRERGV